MTTSTDTDSVPGGKAGRRENSTLPGGTSINSPVSSTWKW